MKFGRYLALVAVLTLTMFAVSCNSGDGSSTAAVDSGGAVTSSGSSDGRVSANDATKKELEAAFEAAGIPNTSQWAREVEDTAHTRWTTPISPSSVANLQSTIQVQCGRQHHRPP